MNIFFGCVANAQASNCTVVYFLYLFEITITNTSFHGIHVTYSNNLIRITMENLSVAVWQTSKEVFILLWTSKHTGDHSSLLFDTMLSIFCLAR